MSCIMIIDDDNLQVLSLKIALEKKGYMVLSTSNGVEGLELIKTSQPDIIILDIMMPGMDGWQTLQKIKTDAVLARIPVIMVSVKELTTDILVKRTELGFSDYVTKPYYVEDLITKISNLT